MHTLFVLLGHPIAFFVSAERKNRLPIMILHGIFGWIYIAYVLLKINFWDKYQEQKTK